MRRRRAALALCAFILLASGLKSMQRERERERPARVAVRAQTAAIAAGTEPTAQAGTRMFQRGGNAVDAGVAAMFAASVYEFSHLGFGGEVSLLIRDKTGRVYTIGGVGTMPRKATADF
ncbi:MAG TPA: gamma-glutamyltransferase, partial [Bryobacteraceae bacterium]|nr:gamma-glutamyltransferase [Bryobacteraceae bacterium]